MNHRTTYSRRRFIGLSGSASASVLLGGDRSSRKR